MHEIVWKRTLDAIKSRSVFYGFARDVGGRCEGVDAAKCFCRQIVPLHEREGIGFAEGGSPAIVKPVGMGMSDGRWEVGHLIEQTLARCDGTAQHGIDEPSHAGFS